LIVDFKLLSFTLFYLSITRQIASRVVSARVQARETLIEIARAVGAPYFHFILTDLQRALKRGYQLHVLGHTLHALLAAVQTQVWTVVGRMMR
jgi:U3 small nucleolar RNA-associated protein 20